MLYAGIGMVLAAGAIGGSVVDVLDTVQVPFRGRVPVPESFVLVAMMAAVRRRR